MLKDRKTLIQEINAFESKLVEIDAAISRAQEENEDTDVSSLKLEFDSVNKKFTNAKDALSRKEKLTKSKKENDENDDEDVDEAIDDEDDGGSGTKDCQGQRDEKKSKKSLEIYRPSMFNIVKKTITPQMKVGMYFWTKNAAVVPQIGRQEAFRMAQKTWGTGYNEIYEAALMRHAVGPMLTTAPATVAQDVSATVVELLSAEAIVRKSGPHIENMSRAGNKTIFRQSQPLAASYTTEATQGTVSVANFDQINLNWHKLTAFTYMSKEELMFPSVDTASYIANELVTRIALKEDIVFLTNPVTSGQPTGLINLINANAVANSTLISNAITWQSVSNDLATLETILVQGLIRPPYCFYMSPSVVVFLKAMTNGFTYPFRDQLSQAQPTLNGWPVYTTTQLNTNNQATVAQGNATNSTPIILAAPRYLIIGDAYSYDMDISTQGSLVDGATQVNLWGIDAVGYKISAAHDFNIMHDRAAAVLNAAGWTSNSAQSAGFGYYNQAQSNTISGASSV